MSCRLLSLYKEDSLSLRRTGRESSWYMNQRQFLSWGALPKTSQIGKVTQIYVESLCYKGCKGKLPEQRVVTPKEISRITRFLVGDVS